MIDYVKILFQNIDASRIYNLPFLDFKTVVSMSTAVISEKKIAKLHHCNIIIYDSGSVYFTGSIHKFWNSLNNVLAPNHKLKLMKLRSNFKGKDLKERLNELESQYKGFNGNQFTINDI